MAIENAAIVGYMSSDTALRAVPRQAVARIYSLGRNSERTAGYCGLTDTDAEAFEADFASIDRAPRGKRQDSMRKRQRRLTSNILRRL